MLVRRVAATVHRLPLLVQRDLLFDRVAVAMHVTVKVGHVPRDQRASRVVPRSAADAIARVHGRLSSRRSRAEVRVPGATAGTRRASELHAVLVRTGKAAEVRAVALADAGNEEAHRLLRLLLLRRWRGRLSASGWLSACQRGHDAREQLAHRVAPFSG